MSFHPVVRPPALRAGDCIGLAAPASALSVRRNSTLGSRSCKTLAFACTTRLVCLRSTVIWPAAMSHGPQNSTRSLPIQPFKAIFCCRGGYGSQRLLPYLDTAVIMAHPKIFVGYSDLTSLLLYLYSQCHLVTLHGPVVVRRSALLGSSRMCCGN